MLATGGLNMNRAGGHDVSDCDVRPSHMGNGFLANDLGFLSAVWASVQNSASEESTARIKLGPNQLLQVTKYLRDIDGKFQCFRELFQRDGKHLFVLPLNTSLTLNRSQRALWCHGSLARWILLYQEAVTYPTPPSELTENEP